MVLGLTMDGVHRSAARKRGKHLWILTAELHDRSGAGEKKFSGYAAVPYEDGDDIKDTFDAALGQGLEQIYSAAQAIHESNDSLVAWLQTPVGKQQEVSPAKKRWQYRYWVRESLRKPQEFTTSTPWRRACVGPGSVICLDAYW